MGALLSLSLCRCVRFILLALIATSLSGCQKWVTVETSPVKAGWVDGQDDVRVITNDGQRILLGSPIHVERDSLRGQNERSRPSSRREAELLAIALSDISALQRSRLDGGSTTAVVVVGGLAATGLVLLVCCAAITY